ncbi:MFS transporter [Lujinxingia sediminis]|nr:MFS transporter [Lujinxingia sediminis]
MAHHPPHAPRDAEPTPPSTPNHYADARTASVVLALLSSVVFFAVVNGNMVNVALPFIGRDFGVSEGVYGWVVTGFSLTFGIFSAIHGRLADLVGLRRLYCAGILALGATSLMLAASPSIEVMIVLRFLQGAGSAALPALGTMIIARVFAPHRRGAAMGLVLGAVGLAASVGPFLGGILVELGGWRLVYGATGLVTLAAPVAFRLLPESLDARFGDTFDTLGALLLGLGVSAWLYAFTIIEQRGFGPFFFGLLGLGLVLLLVFWRRIHRIDEPFAQPEVFRDRRYLTNSAVAFLTNASRFGTIVLVPIFLIEVNQVAPLVVGLVLLPGALLIAVISPWTGRYADRVGARQPIVIGMVLIIAGNLITAYYAGGSEVGVGLGMGLYGLGFALFQSPVVSATSQILPPSLTGSGMGIFMMIFFLGGAFGVALSVTAVELQAEGATSWLGLDLGAGATYSNAILTLTVLSVLALILTRGVPGLHPKPMELTP